MAATGSPPLTTVRQLFFYIGGAIAARLLEFVDSGEAPGALVVPTELVVRGST